MTTTLAAKPVFDLPTDVEQAARSDEVNLLRAFFVLDGRHLEEPVQYALNGESTEHGVTELIGDARKGVEMMILLYGKAGSNATTTSVQSAINLARSRIRQQLVRSGLSQEEAVLALETRDELLPKEQQTPLARGFALAMVFWNLGMTWVQEKLAESADDPAFVGLLAALRQE